ncbi:RagB/SusD family nutrient uptake outer membrane protein [Christiangramia sabulilitoris]|uniref:RagB/SusD family nutrient uptake outer membrane protein n=1 Tax=Christiangramia sabulilitoris TaxID=2583991 RepID=A0A550I0D4_9FLAO|nr:RagB/SusD family nutrient uptake outer membrane protein [Christiangramia sabulilitoris]TRO64433.1 RagB/SusD family nutrient uptake outer membrane protein [Christiangramia sabulilitoris]
MKKIIKNIFLFLTIAGITGSCEVKEFSDLNNPEVDAFRENLTRGDLQDLVGGLFYSMRLRLGTYFDDTGVLGREYWRFSSSDPRFTADLLGKDDAVLDNNTFYITAPWAERYKTVKMVNLIQDYIANNDLSSQLTDAELNSTLGLIKTLKAHELLLNLNLTYENGIRVDVSDPDNLGPFLSYSASLEAIRSLLDEAASDLRAGGDEFFFNLPSGYSGFNTPDSFLEFNQALAARVAAYQEDYTAVLEYLEDSFLELNSDFDMGVYYNFSADQTDLLNPMFFPVEATTAGARIVHPTFIADAEQDDARLDKVAIREEALALDNLSGQYSVFRYKSNVDDIPIIRNEELILLYAEANIFINPSEAVDALNIIRNAAGLDDYSGPTTEAALIDEMLLQRRYSLFAEGHRWIDVRRYDRLDDLPIDREGDNVFAQFPIPLNENQ